MASLPGKNTDSLIGAVVKILDDEGIRLVESTLLLKSLLAGEGTLSRRKPSGDELRDGEYEAYYVARVFSFTPQKVRVPAGARVTFYVTSPDVEHGFSIPETGVNDANLTPALPVIWVQRHHAKQVVESPLAIRFR